MDVLFCFPKKMKHTRCTTRPHPYAPRNQSKLKLNQAKKPNSTYHDFPQLALRLAVVVRHFGRGVHLARVDLRITLCVFLMGVYSLFFVCCDYVYVRWIELRVLISEVCVRVCI